MTTERPQSRAACACSPLPVLAHSACSPFHRIDLPPNLINPLRSYADIEAIIIQNWPSREAMIKAEGADPARFKRILGLTWAHTRPRRNVRTVDIEEEYARAHVNEADEEEDMGTVLDNFKRSELGGVGTRDGGWEMCDARCAMRDGRATREQG